ncbi:MAG: deoxyribodipyrimidine photo-lyase, partial [Cellvibrionales bacterium]|nr:deoxyribodipyrimidine photo-lyase [Cellvibrionales bacterium]
AASNVWLHHSLHSLNRGLKNNLYTDKGDPLNILLTLIDKHQITHVLWNRCYEPWQIKRDTLIKKALLKKGIHVKSFRGNFLYNPLTIKKHDGTPYKVFTPFYRKGCLENQPIPDRPIVINQQPAYIKTNTSIDKLNLLPNIRWDKPLIHHWQPGEDGAAENLNTFIKNGLSEYKKGRDFPASKHISRLSPHLHFGEISVNRIWHAIQSEAVQQPCEEDAAHFLSELGWREFSTYLLYHFPDLPVKNFQPKFDQFPWKKNKKYLLAWQQGQTGYPFIDAGMRELWQTGFMHNRVRMVCGSFLVKNLLIHWQEGERWFWDTLIDADLANNSASWQWVAGSGADAAPYFRIFNPITQSEKFDPEGEYIRAFVPELSQLPNKYIHKPFDVPQKILDKAGIQLGKTYPNPIVDLKLTRELALNAYQAIRK